MSSVHIHQDLYNYERKRKGFTNRQILAIGAAVGVMAGMVALLSYVLELSTTLSIDIALFFAAIPIAIGFLPIAGMPFERFVDYLLAQQQRGATFSNTLESPPEYKGARSKEYAKRTKNTGFECK